MSSDPWSAYLDELERWTSEQARHLALGELDALVEDGVERPAGAVLPPALAGRAQGALEALDRLQDELRRHKQDVALQLHAPSRQAASPGSPPSVYLDSYG